MKVSKSMRTLFLISLFILMTGSSALSQGRQRIVPRGNPTEAYLLLTDRAHYICGEPVHFRVFAAGEKRSTLSSTLYVELVSPDGDAQHSTKTALGTYGGSGFLPIPSGIPSGTYYLKAYSRAMRNCGDSLFAFTSFQAYNPYSEDALAPDSAGLPAPEASFLEDAGLEPASFLDMSLSTMETGTREQMEIVLQNRDSYGLDLSVSVIPDGMEKGQHFYPSACVLPEPDQMRYLPEPRGLSMSGRVLSQPGGSPAPYASVYLSFLEEERNLLCNYADSAGRFYFSLPDYLGNKEIFISAAHPAEDSLSLLIDNDFTSAALNLPSYPFPEEEEAISTITRMSVNATMAAQYQVSGTVAEEDGPQDQVFFYGTPDEVFLFDDYIRLPVLVEYFQEVMPQISVRRQDRKYRFQLNGPHPDLRVFPPLLMIDGVAIPDSEALLAVSPGRVHRVEIVNAPFVRGDLTFGGIISVVTRNGDLGDIDLPSSGLLISYQMLGERVSGETDRLETNPRIPDLRNTLFWEPELILEPGESRSFHFWTGDTRGSYRVLISGKDVDGRYFRKSAPFTVR